jgi:hypothetical protein
MIDWIIAFLTGILSSIISGIILYFITRRIKEKNKSKIIIIISSIIFGILVIIAMKISLYYCLVGFYDKQTYWPPAETGDIYTVIDRKNSEIICLSVEWGQFKDEDRIDLTNYKGLVLRLKHLKADAKPLTVKAKDAIVNIPSQAAPPNEWTNPQYKQVSW